MYMIANVHAKRFTGQIADVAHTITRIEDSYEPVKYSRLAPNPCHELWIDGVVVK